jgi:hypothetical protein
MIHCQPTDLDPDLELKVPVQIPEVLHREPIFLRLYGSVFPVECEGKGEYVVVVVLR